MPTSVLFGKDGTVLTVDGDSYLGSFETISGNIENMVAEHNGPQDEFHYSTALRSKLTINLTGFEPASGGGVPADLVKAKTAVTVACTNLMWGGRALAGTFTPVSCSNETPTEASKYSMTLESFGEWTLT